MNRNMFLAAAPYFRVRFHTSPWALKHFQPVILSVSTVTNLACVLVFTRRQRDASYPLRIVGSLALLIVVFALLTLSTVDRGFRSSDLPVGLYFIFVMTMVFCASFATGLNQNGVFAYVSGFGRPEYTQAIMTGQAVAGVLPCIVQIISVLAVSGGKGGEEKTASKAAFYYFLAAVVVSGIALFGFLYLAKRATGSWTAILQNKKSTSEGGEDEDDALPPTTSHKSFGLLYLFQKLQWLALALYFCFMITMVFPVFTTMIESTQDPAHRSPLFDTAAFIPLAFLFWNAGDLLGRLSVLNPSLASLARFPRALFAFSLARLLFVPLYMMCNVNGQGGITPLGRSDAFYLIVVQFGFGLTNGFLGSVCMMGAGQYVTVEEKGAAGAFMSMMLVAGLATGSLLSFLFVRS